MWVESNHLKANPEKCHVILILTSPVDVWVGDAAATASTKQTLLEIIIDSEVSAGKWKIFFILTQLFRTISCHAMNVIIESQKQ